MADEGYTQQDPADQATPFNVQQFVIQQMISKISTAKIVKVLAVDTAAKTVDVRPMVNQVDGDNNATPHGKIYGVPYNGWQYGKNAITADPAVDDMGVMLCADRDISAVKSAKDFAPPGSSRQYDFADGIYLGGLLTTEDPEQFIKFTDDGIEMQAKGSHTLKSTVADGWTVDKLTVTGNLQLAGDIVDDGGGTYGGNIHTTGTVFADTDVQAGSGGARVTMKGHFHAANNTPATPGH